MATSAVSPGSTPGADRHAVACHRQGDDHLRLVVAAFLAVAAPAQWRKQPPTPFLGLLVGFIDLEIGRGGVVEDQIDVEAEQIGGFEKDFALDAVRPDGEEIKRPVELIDAKSDDIGQEGNVGYPARGTSELGAGHIQPVRRHGEECGLMRRGQFAFGDAAPNRRADAEIVPQAARGQHDAEFEHLLDLDLRDRRRRGGTGDRLALIEHAVDAVNQALQGGAVELVRAAEIVHDACLGAFGCGVPGVLGQGVIADCRTVPILSLRDP